MDAYNPNKRKRREEANSKKEEHIFPPLDKNINLLQFVMEDFEHLQQQQQEQLEIHRKVLQQRRTDIMQVHLDKYYSKRVLEPLPLFELLEQPFKRQARMSSNKRR
jgi:spore cortex formation protein SpoVR/YcgB (stage V sporulation)